MCAMNVRVCLELCARNDAGAVKDTFGLNMDLGESAREIDYQELTAAINKEGVLRAAGLDGVVSPEDATFITPQEYDEKYGA